VEVQEQAARVLMLIQLGLQLHRQAFQVHTLAVVVVVKKAAVPRELVVLAVAVTAESELHQEAMEQPTQVQAVVLPVILRELVLKVATAHLEL
jgi:hypothetical protein